MHFRTRRAKWPRTSDLGAILTFMSTLIDLDHQITREDVRNVYAVLGAMRASIVSLGGTLEREISELRHALFVLESCVPNGIRSLQEDVNWLSERTNDWVDMRFREADERTDARFKAVDERFDQLNAKLDDLLTAVRPREACE